MHLNKMSAVIVMKQNEKFDEPFEPETVILPLLIGCIVFDHVILH